MVDRSTGEKRMTDEKLRIAVVLGLAFGAFAIAYYRMVYIRQANNQALVSDYRARLETEIVLSVCLDKSRRVYQEDGDKYCRSLGKRDDCILPLFYKGKLEQKLQTDRDDCYKNIEAGNSL